MKGEAAARNRLGGLERRVLDQQPELLPKLWQVSTKVRQLLEEAHFDGLLKQSPREIRALLDAPHDPDPDGGAVIRGGLRAEAWEADPQFERDDGARFNFEITLLYPPNEANARRLVSYHCNIAFQDGRHPVMVRLDYVKLGGVESNATIPLRCHTHPGTPKMTVPSPVLSPLELLDVVLRHHLRES